MTDTAVERAIAEYDRLHSRVGPSGEHRLVEDIKREALAILSRLRGSTLANSLRHEAGQCDIVDAPHRRDGLLAAADRIDSELRRILNGESPKSTPIETPSEYEDYRLRPDYYGLSATELCGGEG